MNKTDGKIKTASAASSSDPAYTVEIYACWGWYKWGLVWYGGTPQKSYDFQVSVYNTDGSTVDYSFSKSNLGASAKKSNPDYYSMVSSSSYVTCPNKISFYCKNNSFTAKELHYGAKVYYKGTLINSFYTSWRYDTVGSGNVNNTWDLSSTGVYSFSVNNDTQSGVDKTGAITSFNVLSSNAVYPVIKGSSFMVGNKTISYSAPTLAHYKFLGYYNGNTKIYNSDLSLAYTGKATANGTLQAKWEIDKHTVSLGVNDSSYGTISATSIANVPYGSTITTSGNTLTVNGTTVTATPSNATAQYTYAFDKFEMSSTTVGGNMSITAKFTRTLRSYNVVFKNYDGATLKSESVAYGTTPTYTGETPVKPATAQITYTFAGWTPALTSVTGAATYTATFTESARKYDICFINFDGTVLKNYSLEYGETPEYDGDIPVKPATEQKSFTFNGWDKEIATVTGDQTYSATYSEIYNASVSLSLGGEIVVNFYIYLPYYTADENAYFTLTYNHNKTSYSTERTTDTVSINELEQRADGRYKISCGLASAQICDLIDLRLFDGSDNLLYSKTDYSIRDYCNAVIDGGYNENLVDLCKSIMNYGGYAQILFGYNVDDVANAEKDYASDIESVNVEDIKEQKNIEEGATDFALTGDITLMALDKSAIRFYFDLENEEDLSDYEISVSEGFKVRTGENNVGKFIEVYNILSINYSKAFTVTVKNISDLTETTITYSVLDNIKAKLMGNASVNTKNLSKAMYLFGLASSAFFGN